MSLILIPVKKVLLAFLKGEFQSVSQTEECVLFLSVQLKPKILESSWISPRSINVNKYIQLFVLCQMVQNSPLLGQLVETWLQKLQENVTLWPALESYLQQPQNPWQDADLAVQKLLHATWYYDLEASFCSPKQNPVQRIYCHFLTTQQSIDSMKKRQINRNFSHARHKLPFAILSF